MDGHKEGLETKPVVMKNTFTKIFAFLLFVLIVGSAAAWIWLRLQAVPAHAGSTGYHRAMYYEKLSGGTVQCFLCPNRCILSIGQFGLCKARKNIDGELYSLVYGKIATVHVDPIEKKPFFHVLPSSQAFSIATTGCNMRCLFCQNWEISQVFPNDILSIPMTPEQVVEKALQSRAESIAFTYTEPVISYEYMLDIAKLAKAKGLKTLVVSSGYIEQTPLKELLKYIDAYKVDLKAFDEKFYNRLTGGHLQPILETIQTIHQNGVWLEIVTLIIPGQNDSEDEIRSLARWLKENIGPDVPLHFSRFHPQYKLGNLPPTPVETLIRARAIAMEEGMKFVYVGNVDYSDGEATYCPQSGEKAIERRGYFVIANRLKNGVCPDGEKIPGIWK
ncbi:MAG: AmmeMemoRadiSam system radical SAM enzyme [Candidatus Omnitrophica bacterium]|nr:AmmeMemoRadiSam system radical SAM enzyme [Candidatus Omnitrophota bacterium]